jgi:Spy/CpxP family protein refolding chaperone
MGEFNMRVAIAVAALVAFSGPLSAQHIHGQSRYAGFQSRQIKALAPEQLADLRAGRGMGLALAGEMNGYPGPAHVLELSDKLHLSSEQRDRIRRLFDAMKAEAIPVGERLIEQEAELDREFAERKITPLKLAELTARIGDVQGRLRAIHLKYHLTTAELLSPEQKSRYAELRGYQKN